MQPIVWILWDDGRITAVTEDIAQGFAAIPWIALHIVKTAPNPSELTQ